MNGGPPLTPAHNPRTVRPMQATLTWTNLDATPHTALWRSEAGVAPPTRVQIADDTTTADVAFRLACEGTAVLWQGDFHNAKQLLQAIARRVDRRQPPRVPPGSPPGTAFHLHRKSQAERARILGMVLVPVLGDYTIPLRRAPDQRAACTDAWGPATGEASVVSLRELLGLVGAHQWRVQGVWVPALQARVHPQYGVFSPGRGEYVDLVAEAPLPATTLAIEVGVGTGVLTAVLARRGVQRIVATDTDPRALACAQENLTQLGLADRAELVQADLWPDGAMRAPLVVCNPPWLPARPHAPIERALYDADSAMLRAFLTGLAAHLTPDGEGWLILSDLAEHLGLRTRDQLLGWVDAAGLQVLARHDTRPRHGKAQDPGDPLHAARAAEVTSLWRLGVRAG